MMEEHIGFPDYILDPVLLDKDFEHVSFFSNECLVSFFSLFFVGNYVSIYFSWNLKTQPILKMLLDIYVIRRQNHRQNYHLLMIVPSKRLMDHSEMIDFDNFFFSLNHRWTVMPSVVNAQYHRFRNLMSKFFLMEI